MALTKKDLHQIQELLTSQLSAQDQRLRLDLRDALQQQAQDIKRDIRDEMDARFTAFERHMDRKIHEHFVTFRHEIRSEFMDVLHTNILPVIDKAFQEIGEVRKFVGMA